MSDPSPWYKHFWPCFIVALVGSVVVASFATLYIALNNPDGLVSDNYYKEGLAINQRLEQDNRASELGVVVELEHIDNELSAELQGANNVSALKVQFAHPLDSEKDFSLTMARQSNTRFVGQLETEISERYYISVSDIKNDWRVRRLSNGLLSGKRLRIEAKQP